MPTLLLFLTIVAALPAEQHFSDSLTAHPAGTSLGAAALERGDATWNAAGSSVLQGPAGATTRDDPGGTAAHAIPCVCGRLCIRGELRPVGSGFAGLALGGRNLAGDFWKSYDLLAFLTPGGSYGVLAHGDFLAKGSLAAGRPFQGEQFHPMAMSYDSAARTLTVEIDGTAILKNCDLSQRKDRFAICAAGFRFNEHAQPDKPAVRNYSVDVTAATASGLTPVDLADFFLAPDRPATLKLRAAMLGQTDQVAYELHNYEGRPVAHGSGTVSPDGLVQISPGPLARGFYELRFPVGRESFGLVVLEPHEGPRDAFFAIDAGLSWLETRGGAAGAGPHPRPLRHRHGPGAAQFGRGQSRPR